MLPAAFEPTTGAQWAVVSKALDQDRLSLWDTLSSTLLATLDVATPGTRVTSLDWVSLPLDLKSTKGPSSAPRESMVALGLSSGKIDIFSPSLGKVIASLAGGHSGPVAGFVAAADGRHAYSGSADRGLVEWALGKNTVARKCRAATDAIHALALDPAAGTLVVAGSTLCTYSLKTLKLVKSFNGHATPITGLATLQADPVLVSIAAEDRFANVWVTSTDAAEQPTSYLSALTLESVPTHISVSPASGALLAVTEDGSACIWASTRSSPPAEPGHKKRKKVMNRGPDCALRFFRNDKAKTTSPILSACFLTHHQTGPAPAPVEIMVARASYLKPSFERVTCTDETGKLIKNMAMTRQGSTNILMTDLAKSQTMPTKAVHDMPLSVLAPSDMAMPSVGMLDANGEPLSPRDEPSLEEKLQSLAVSQAQATPLKTLSAGAGTGAAAVKVLPSLLQMLVQAVHTGDKELLDRCLAVSKKDLIFNTVRGLPTRYVVGFVTQVLARFEGKPGREAALLEWLRALLLSHMAYLLTVPDVVARLGGLYQTLVARTQTFDHMLKLAGRLDMVMAQVSMRSTAQTEALEPGLVYNESDGQDSDSSEDAHDYVEDMEMGSDMDLDAAMTEDEPEDDGDAALSSDEENLEVYDEDMEDNDEPDSAADDDEDPEV